MLQGYLQTIITKLHFKVPTAVKVPNLHFKVDCIYPQSKLDDATMVTESLDPQSGGLYAILSVVAISFTNDLKLLSLI